MASGRFPADGHRSEGQETFDLIRRHVGHKIEVVTYGDVNSVDAVAIECDQCSEVLFDADKAIEYAEPESEE